MKLLLFVFALISSSKWSTSTSCGNLDFNNYTSFETLLLTDENLIKLENAFFPVNSHPSVVVDVHYHLIVPIEAIPETVLREAVYQPVEEVSPARTNVTKSGKITVYKFRWLSSPVNLFIRPDLLKRFSLLTYQVNVTAVDLQFSLCQPKELEILNKSACTSVPMLLTQLNTITANVSCTNCLSLEPEVN